MKQYLELVRKVLETGKEKDDRTGIGTRAIFGEIFSHNMSEGFPLLTTKKMAFNSIKVELEGFLKGITDKRWYQERGCAIWDEWCNPKIVPYGHDEETKRRMREERDLGPLYGWQWRYAGAKYRGFNVNYAGEGEDQLTKAVRILKTNPSSRRMVVSAWNAPDLEMMALDPCHYTWQIDVIDKELHLSWDQRSVDTMLGLPFNITSYGLLLHLLAKESGFKEGKLVGFLGDTHIYNNHIKGAKEQLTRIPRQLPKAVTDGFTSIFDWTHQDTKFEGYDSYPKINFEIAV